MFKNQQLPKQESSVNYPQLCYNTQNKIYSQRAHPIRSLLEVNWTKYGLKSWKYCCAKKSPWNSLPAKIGALAKTKDLSVKQNCKLQHFQNSSVGMTTCVPAVISAV